MVNNMKRQLLIQLLLILTTKILALQPNIVQTTNYNVDGNGSKIVTTEYTDGLGKNLQTKLKLKPDSITSKARDRVSCTFYDSIGRPSYIAKTFIDTIDTGVFHNGEIIDNGTTDNKLELQLFKQYSDQNAFSKTQYWDYPQGGVRTTSGPGHDSIYGDIKSWALGVGLKDTSSLPIIIDGIAIGNVDFDNGLIMGFRKTSSAISFSEFIDAIYTQFLLNNPFLNNSNNPSYLLAVSMAPDGKITEELKDLDGKTIRTLSDPDINSASGLRVVAEYLYDKQGNVLKETPPGATNTEEKSYYRYNTLGQLIYKKTPDGGEYEYNYRIDGQIDFVLSFTGTSSQWYKKTGYLYDDLGRVTRIFVLTPDTLKAADSVIYNFYDDVNVIKGEKIFSDIPEDYLQKLNNLRGRLVGTVSVNFSGNEKQIDVGELFSYNSDGQIDRKYMIIGGSRLIQETVYTYDIHGKLLTESFNYAGNNVIKKYQYDELGRLFKVINCEMKKNGSYVEKELVNISYDLLGRQKVKTLSAITAPSYELSYEYDIRDRLKKLNAPTNRYGYSIENISYNKSGNVDNIQSKYRFNNIDTQDSLLCSQSYVYDHLNRLESVNSSDTGFNADYSYDITGRFRTKKEGSVNLTGYNYYQYTNRLKNTSKNPAAGNEYIYSRNGNLLVDFTKKMVIEYDWRDMPCMFRFYDTLEVAGITHDTKGTYNGTNLYSYMQNKVDDGTVTLLSKVMMIYDAGGNRVAKMDVRE